MAKALQNEFALEVWTLRFRYDVEICTQWGGQLDTTTRVDVVEQLCRVQ
jgi:hypothetical protein